MRQNEIEAWQKSSLSDAEKFCNDWKHPYLYMVRDCIELPTYPELLQVEYWELEVMLKRAIIDEGAWHIKLWPNGFTELIENIKWNIQNLKDNNEWLCPLSLTH